VRLLIVTAWYAPFIHPRAHRWAALAEHWAAQGHEVHVVCGRRRDCAKGLKVNGVYVHRTGFDSLKEWVYYHFGSQNARGRVGALPQKPTFASRIAAWLYRAVWKNLCFPDDAALWYFPAKKRAAQLFAAQPFDVLISVSLPFSGHLVGLFLKKKHPRLTWLADIGDPFSFSPNPQNNLFWFEKINRRLERRVLQTADRCIVTCEALLHKYQHELGQQAVKKMYVIPPLLTNSLAAEQHETRNTKHETRIAFFGALYAPVRTPDALLHLLTQIRLHHPDLYERSEIHFYGEIFPEFFEKLNAESCIRLHGLCSREAAWAAIQQADILLNIGNTTDFQLPSKAVDYLASGKPVLNLSYTERDPFAQFLEKEMPDKSLIFNLKVKNGRVGEQEARRCAEWLGAEKTPVGKEDLERRIAQFSVEKIGEDYLHLAQRTAEHQFRS